MLKVKKLHDEALMPTRAHQTDLGYDLYALEDTAGDAAGKPIKVRTGIAVSFPEGWGGILKDRSSMASQGITTSGGVIDAGYTGEICIMLSSNHFLSIKKHQKIAQLVPTQVVNWNVVEVDELPIKDRGSKGFGSSD